MNQLTIALDWTPNINHIGFFVARDKGFYQNQGLSVIIRDPYHDNYILTPAKKVEKGKVDMALCPTESIISYRTKSRPFPLIGIAAIFQKDLSAIAVRPNGGLHSPKDLDGRTYASYNARYEDEIVRQLIRNDGGTGDIRIKAPEKLGIWHTLLSGHYDSTWIFTNWEGVAATAKGADLTTFQLEDYDIPYSYSPVIVTSEALLAEKSEALTAFLKATKQGFMYCLEEPEEAAEVLATYIPESDQHIDLREALALSASAFGNSASWGRMDEQVVETFLSWLKEKGLEPRKLSTNEVVTNQLLDSMA